MTEAKKKHQWWRDLSEDERRERNAVYNIRRALSALGAERARAELESAIKAKQKG